MGERDELESFVDKSLLFAGRDRYLSSRTLMRYWAGFECVLAANTKSLARQ